MTLFDDRRPTFSPILPTQAIVQAVGVRRRPTRQMKSTKFVDKALSRPPLNFQSHEWLPFLPDNISISTAQLKDKRTGNPKRRVPRKLQTEIYTMKRKAYFSFFDLQFG